MRRYARIGKIARQTARAQKLLANGVAYLVESSGDHSRIDIRMADFYFRSAEANLRRARRGIEILEAEQRRELASLEDALR